MVYVVTMVQLPLMLAMLLYMVYVVTWKVSMGESFAVKAYQTYSR